MLLTAKPFETFPKHNIYGFMSEIFALNWYIFGHLQKKLLLPLKCRLKQKCLFSLEKLIEYSTSAVIVVSSNPCVGPLPRTKISFFLLSICTDRLMNYSKNNNTFTSIKTWKWKKQTRIKPISWIRIFTWISIYS